MNSVMRLGYRTLRGKEAATGDIRDESIVSHLVTYLQMIGVGVRGGDIGRPERGTMATSIGGRIRHDDIKQGFHIEDTRRHSRRHS